MFGLEPADQILGDPIRMDINLACYIAVVEGENTDNDRAKETKNRQDGMFNDAIMKELEELSERSKSRG
jgi:hypothetical protein